ncbi:MAG: Asp-tRNA(Asn)/Glu-tRNA(Gln) amidotransferase subunit GatA [bacterium]|nr:Asp-tRNA(Asn)/Glu-tRNA(Gln) amidotransferase subunit GatA [bacterium]
MSFDNLTIAKIVSGIKTKQFSAREIASFYFERIKKNDKNFHAYLETFEGDALGAAEHIDKKIALGEIEGSLVGVPFAIKDNILISGKRATAGSRVLEPYIATYDATVVKKIKEEGGLFLGKTNLDEFAMGSSTENSAFGPTRNPHDLDRVPGGSSGGSAAAVASDLAPAALGSDTGGSIRQPAAFCGVVGLKPTYGAVSRHGLIAMASSLDQIGPITKTVEDTAILFEAVRGRDRYDTTTVETKAGQLKKGNSLKGVSVGVPKEYFGEGIENDVVGQVRAAIDVLSGLGADVKEVSLPNVVAALATYYIVMPAEVSSNLARFDGIRYGHTTADARDLFEVYSKSRKEGFGSEVKRRIMLGTYVLSAGYYDAYYGKAQRVRRLIREDFKRAFEKVDIMVGPTTPTPAFRFGEKTDDPLQMYLADIYTVAINLAGVPALSVPCGEVLREGKNLPVALQMIGKWFDESFLLSAAFAYEQAAKK